MGLGVAVFTMAMSALFALATTTMAVALLPVRLGTMLEAVAVAVSVMFVPEGVAEITCSATVKVPLPLIARLLPSVQVIVPVPPTAGTVPQIHPAGGVIDWNVVFGGVV